jgi:hypothetical protein
MEKIIKDCLTSIEKRYPNNYEYGSKMRIFIDYIKEERTEEEILIFTEYLNKK